ncbi:MAG: hypothetical protein K9G67_16020 [Bacteroidales bacterium]|nr:hypothetical protein [Bacteroidales bacterium]MCF8345299.1 hypothetical protein [Bacteroidales bacterium]MCF8352664.1 hypothetical protein [Bacteroidales bacterium]MCF8377863.1 hypothetical protein [Bacteroidales bacterium]
MNIQTEKIEIVKMILETDNERILKSIKNIFKKEGRTDFWNSLTPEQKKEIELGIEEIDQGETDDYDEFMKNHR